MTTVLTTIEGRTFLECVQRIVAATGETRPGSLVSPTDRVYRAMMAVNNAYDRIWNAAKWPFKSSPREIALVSNQMWYELPGDFQRIHTPPTYNSSAGKLTYTNIEVLLHKNPHIRIFPPGGEQGLTTISQHSANTYFGVPSQYTLDGSGYLGLFLIPDADFVTEQAYLQYRYWKIQPSLVDDGDLIELTKELWYCHYLLSLGEYKSIMEYADGPNDTNNGEVKLHEAIAMYGLMDTRADERITEINYNE